jgi:DNA uptake protein ComE-like DNA-binding protein
LTGEDQPTEEDESPEMPEPEPDQELSEWIPEIAAETETAQETLEPEDHAVADVEPEIEPLEIEEEPDVIAELAAAAEVDLDQVEEEQTSEEIPGWLSDLAGDKEIAAEPQSTDWTPDMLVEDVVEPEAQLETFLDEKLDLNAASLIQLEKIPGIGFIHAQNIVNYRAASGPYSDLDQLEEVDGLTADIIAELNNYLIVEVVAEVASTESEFPELQAAWDSIIKGNIDQAVNQYADLINRDQHLDEVIRDLQAALGKYPMDSSLYQSLGDAYVHANMLQEALDAYNRAEDLFK